MAIMIVTPHGLVGKRVLIVEDEFAVALLIEDLLLEFGCIPVGPCPTVAAALDAIGTTTFDVAVLDVSLDDGKVYPVADALVEHQIPFVFVSGYEEDTIPTSHRAAPICTKPFRSDRLAAMLLAAMEKTHLPLRIENRPVSDLRQPVGRHAHG